MSNVIFSSQYYTHIREVLTTKLVNKVVSDYVPEIWLEIWPECDVG